MQNLKWLAILPAAMGLVFVLFALLWTQWPQLLVGTVLLVVGLGVWRAFAGTWPKLS